MKKIILILFAFVGSVSISAQTEEQLKEWKEQGSASAQKGNYQEAIRCYELYKEGYGKLHSREDETYDLILFILADYYASSGNHQKAIEIGLQELDIAEKLTGTNHPDYALSLSNLANYFFYLGDYAKAVEMATKALEIRRETLGKNHPDFATSQSNLALFYSHLGDNTKAVEMATKAMEIFRELFGEKHHSYAASLSNLANYYNHLGDYAVAVEMGTKAMDFYREVLGEKHPNYAISLNNLANYYSHLGGYTKAVEIGTKVMEIQRESLGEKHPDYALSLNNLADYYSHLGDYAKAVEMGTKAMEIYREALGEKHPSYAGVLHNLAYYYFHLGYYAKAVELGTKAMEIYRDVFGEKHPNYASSLDNLASYYSDLGDYAKAVEMGMKAMELFRDVLGEKHPDYAISLNNLAKYYSFLGDFAKMLKYYCETTSIIQEYTLQQFAGLTASQRNMFWEKYSYLFIDRYPLYTYKSHVTSAPDLYDKSALFAKGLLLSTEIEMNRLIQESGDEEALRMFEELQRNRLQLQKQYETPIAERNINTDSLAQMVDRQEKDLIKRSKVYGDFTHKLRTTWQEVQGALKDEEIAVEFLSFKVYGTDSTMVAALTLRKDDKEPKFIPLFEQKQLRTVSDTMYYHCPELTTLVWQPLQQELKGVKRIYFSPAGVLHNIGIEYAPGMENYEMYRLSTTREIITHPETQPKTHPDPPQGREKEAVLYGGVDYDASVSSNTPPSEGTGEASGISIALHRAFIDSLDIRGAKAKIQKLPGTKAEVEDIKRSFDDKHRSSSLYTGADATETSVKVISGTKPKILHIATHGFYFTEDQASRAKERIRLLSMADASPSLGGGQGEVSSEDKALTRSGLLMAGVNILKDKDLPMEADDGILTAQEISRLDLRGLDLVVLSACKTGKGDINQGEGVFGLQRGFKKAGAQTLVMSLWEVADDATQILMTAFYDNLLKGESKREAFMHAQQYLRQCDNGIFDRPEYWAAFILLD